MEPRAKSTLARPLLAVPAATIVGRQRRDGEPLVAQEFVLWEGRTWEAVPKPFCCLAPIFCLATSWTVTSARIDKRSGFCGASEATLDLRRIGDLRHSAGAFPCCCCTGVVRIFAPSEHGFDGEAVGSHSDVVIDTFDAHTLFSRLTYAVAHTKAAPVGQA